MHGEIYRGEGPEKLKKLSSKTSFYRNIKNPENYNQYNDIQPVKTL